MVSCPATTYHQTFKGQWWVVVARGYLAVRGYLVRDIRGGPCTRISRTPRISRTFTRYPRDVRTRISRSPRISRTFLQRDIRGGPCTRISRNIWLQSSSIILKGNLDFVGCGLWHLWVVGCMWVLGCVVHFMLCDFRKKHVATTSIILIQNQQNTLLNKISHSDISWYTRLRPLFGILPIKSEVTSSIGKLIQHQQKSYKNNKKRYWTRSLVAISTYIDCNKRGYVPFSRFCQLNQKKHFQFENCCSDMTVSICVYIIVSNYLIGEINCEIQR